MANDENIENEGRKIKLDLSFNLIKEQFEYLLYSTKIKDLKIAGNDIELNHKTIDILS